jgi:hypothetical protein
MKEREDRPAHEEAHKAGKIGTMQDMYSKGALPECRIDKWNGGSSPGDQRQDGGPIDLRVSDGGSVTGLKHEERQQ